MPTLPDSPTPWEIVLWIGRLAGVGGVIAGTHRVFFYPAKIRGEITAAWFFCPFSSEPGELIDAEIILALRVVNRGHRPVSVSQWGLISEVGRVRYAAEAEEIKDSLVACWPNTVTDGISSVAQLRTEWPLVKLRENHERFEHAKNIAGWLRFLIHGADHQAIRDHGHLELFAVDALGKRHKVAVHNPGGEWGSVEILDSGRWNDAFELRAMDGPKPPGI
jgi:hypothetical protein